MGRRSTAPPRSRPGSSRSCSSAAIWSSPRSSPAPSASTTSRRAEGGADWRHAAGRPARRTCCCRSTSATSIQLNSDGQFFLHEIATGRPGAVGALRRRRDHPLHARGLLLVVLRGRALRAAALSRIAGPLLVPAVRRRPQPSRGDQGPGSRARPPADAADGWCRRRWWRSASVEGLRAATGASRWRRGRTRGSRACGSTRTAS